MLYRYDVLLMENIDLNYYGKLDENIYVNAHPDCNGDFHFVMNSQNASDFKLLNDSI